MPTKPLTYESLKCVLLNMDPNLRFLISIHMPRIKVTEKLIPLKIKSMKFDDMKVTINDTEYTIGIIREYRNGPTPIRIREENERGGIFYDTDKYGIRDVSDDSDPRFVLARRDRAPEGDTVETLETQLGICRDYLFHKKSLLEVNEECAKNNHVPCVCRAMSPIESTEDHFEEIKSRLFAFYCRRDNIEPHIRLFIQLLIESPFGRRIELVEYTKKLPRAMENIVSSVFLKRREIPEVKRFEINSDAREFHVPGAFKIKANEFLALGNASIKVYDVEYLIDFRNKPLDLLQLSGPVTIIDLMSEIVRNSKKLVISSHLRNTNDIQNTRNREVHVNELRFLLNGFRDLIRNWKQTHRQIGTLLTFNMGEDDVIESFGTIPENFHDAIAGDRSFIIPMTHLTKLSISYEVVRPEENICLVTMRVVNVQ